MNEMTPYAKIALKRLGYVAAQLEPTSRCFQKCPSCFAKTCDEKAEWLYMDMESLLKELAETPTFEHLTLTGGDPQAHPDLDKLLWYWRSYCHPRFSISLSTAMMREATQYVCEVNRIRLSLDAITPRTYFATRGVERDPSQALEWAASAGTKLGVLTCLSTTNMHEIIIMAETLKMLCEQDPLYRKLDRWSVVPMIGTDEVASRKVMEAYQELERWRDAQSAPLPFVCAVGYKRLQDFYDTRKRAADEESPSVVPPCWTSYVSCHIKSNMEVYPCCLIGGEATAVQKQYCIGSLAEESLGSIYHRYTRADVPSMCLCKHAECRKVCQIKQHSFSCEANLYRYNELTMP